MPKTISVPQRKDIPEDHKWSLEKLFHNDDEWEKGLEKLESMLEKIAAYKGSLAESPEKLYACLDYMKEVEQLAEKVGYYAHLKTSEDVGSSRYQANFARYMSIATKIEAASSYQTPEIQKIPEEKIKAFLENENLADYRIMLEKILRFKPHVLSEKEERLLALQSEANQTASKGFSALTDVDLEFGTIETKEGEKPLSQSSFSSFMIDPDRGIREKAYKQFYRQFEGHKHTLSALYAGTVHLDVYKANIRSHPSSRAAALFPDKVPEEVYDNLIKVIHDNLPSLHAYYSLRKRILGLSELRHYDVYVPLINEIRVTHTYEQAVNIILPALAPLGEEYCDTLESGLLGRWVDRYENKGKRSGAFSAGSYFGDPYILMNYKEDVLRDVFTLAHEGGHSMHSWYSARNNPFQHYNYTIFEAEVASTFNEQLLAEHMLKNSADNNMKAYLIGKQVDDIIGTIFRQTMFAEYEHICHKMVESGTPLTVESLRETYRNLIEQYFGPEMHFEEESDLEGLRIPHFYRAFYVYKYATGLSAAISLSRNVISGGMEARDSYLSFLKSGGSKYPLEALQLAGVDMSRPEPIQQAMEVFKTLIGKLEELLGKN